MDNAPQKSINSYPQEAIDKNLQESINRAHNEIWRRFVYEPYGILLDFNGIDGGISIPTPEECRDGKINAISWWTPIENGAFFNGLYLAGLCHAWHITGAIEKREKAKKLAQGLILLATVGNTPGFIARGISSDGESHYLIGSDDQTAPWFYGLYKFIKSGIPGETEKNQLISLMEKVAKALRKNNWFVPCDSMGENRGEFISADFRAVSRLLFIIRAMYELTGEISWLDEYNDRLYEKPEDSQYTRLDICANGMSLDIGKNHEMSYHMWIFACSQAALKELADMEQDNTIRSQYQRGMTINGYIALPIICRYWEFDNQSAEKYNINWRMMNDIWKPQNNVKAAIDLAMQQINTWEDREMPARRTENRYMREPLFAAWILTLSGEKKLIEQAKPVIIRCLYHYNWSRLYTSLFFIAECTYYELLTC